MRLERYPDELEDLWDDFRRSLARRNRSPATLEVYRKSFESFWDYALAAGLPPDPAAVDHRTINRWLDDMLTAPVVRNGQVVYDTDPETGEKVPRLVTPSTRRIRFVNLRPFFSWWAKEFEVESPFAKADTPGEDRPTPIPVVEMDDVRTLIGACKAAYDTAKARKGSPGLKARDQFEARRDEAMIRVLFDTGARLGELLNLRVVDFDRRQDRLTLTGKTGTRIVPLSPSTAEALSRYLRERKDHTYAASPALWLSRKGALKESGVAQLLRRRCQEAGINHINPHRFRHTWAHESRSAGVSEGELMYLAGWKSTAMAHRYGHSAAAARAEAAARRINLGDRL
ncbi:MAG: tyrosine-type recombinase/integrase [Acidimicrobiia bacterium]